MGQRLKLPKPHSHLNRPRIRKGPPVIIPYIDMNNYSFLPVVYPKWEQISGISRPGGGPWRIVFNFFFQYHSTKRVSLKIEVLKEIPLMLSVPADVE